MIELVQCTTTGVFGPVASGKTYLFQKWLETQNRFVGFDATGELLEIPGIAPIWHSPKQLMQAIEASPYYFRLAYVPGRNIVEDFNWCLRVLWQFDAPKLMAVDEFHLVCPNQAGLDEDMETMLRFSRHAKLGIIGMSQRIADVHKLFTSACRLTILFWTQEARDLDAIRDRWGTKVSLAVQNLRPLIYDDVSQTTKQIPQCVVCRKGAGFKIFDFAKDNYVSVSGPVDEPEQDDDDELEYDPTTGQDKTGNEI